MIKVLRIITRLNNGGPAKQAIWLSSLLDHEKYEKILLAGQTEENEDDILWFAERYNVSPILLKNLKRSIAPISDIKSLSQVYKFICERKPDIIHTHMSKAGLLGRAAGIIYNLLHKHNIKLVHTFHGHIFHSYFSTLKTRLFIFIERVLAKKTTALIAISNKQKEEINIKYRIGKKGQFRTIPLGIDYGNIKKKKRGRGNKTSSLKIGMMGRISDIKNYELAIGIADEIKKNKIDAVIHVAGGGGGGEKDLNALIEKVKQKNLQDRILFHGNIKNPEEFWKDIDIAMITSKNEGTPVSLIEAMLTGIPFIASEVGGIPDMTVEPLHASGNIKYYKNCILIGSFSQGDFFKGIQYYFEKKQARIEAGTAGAKFAASVFTIDRLLDDIRKLYESILSE